jgi:hypothetical protein
MSDETINLLPDAPNQAYVAIAAAFVRGLIQIASGVGMGWGAFVSGEQITMIAWGIVMLGTLIWSAYQKLQSARRRERAAIVSAVRSAEATQAAGTPVAIAVTNPKAV